MTRSSQWTILLVGMLSIVAGCQTNSPYSRKALDAEFFWGNTSRIKSLFSAEELAAPLTAEELEAMDATAVRPLRRKLIAQLFATYVKPGFTSQQMRTALRDTWWLNSCKIHLIGAIAGAHPPVYYGDEHTDPFIMYVFPDETGWSPWV